jgi:hypothetical protein
VGAELRHLLLVGLLLLQLLRLRRKRRRKKRSVSRLVFSTHAVLSDPHLPLTQEESDDDMGFGLFD